MRRLACLTLLLCVPVAIRAQDAFATKTRARFEAAKPDDARLAFYGLDWAMSLKDAKARAAKEGRPCLVILNTNITAGTNFFSGHT